jgi:hypothetical protein
MIISEMKKLINLLEIIEEKKIWYNYRRCNLNIL